MLIEKYVFGILHFGSGILVFWFKVLFTDCCRWQNFCPSLLHLVNNCVESIYKTQKTRTKILPSVTVGDYYFSNKKLKVVQLSGLEVYKLVN